MGARLSISFQWTYLLAWHTADFEFSRRVAVGFGGHFAGFAVHRRGQVDKNGRTRWVRIALRYRGSTSLVASEITRAADARRLVQSASTDLGTRRGGGSLVDADRTASPKWRVCWRCGGTRRIVPRGVTAHGRVAATAGSAVFRVFRANTLRSFDGSKRRVFFSVASFQRATQAAYGRAIPRVFSGVAETGPDRPLTETPRVRILTVAALAGMVPVSARGLLVSRMVRLACAGDGAPRCLGVVFSILLGPMRR